MPEAPSNCSVILPDPAYHASWLEAAAEHARAGDIMHGSGDAGLCRPSHPASFAEWCETLLAAEDHATPLAPDRVHASYRWLVADDVYLGCYSLRHGLTHYLENYGGHLGYSVRPSARRRGLATAATRDALALAATLGMDRILVTTDDDNVASQGVALACGGVHEDTRTSPEGEVMRRYWLPVQ